MKQCPETLSHYSHQIELLLPDMGHHMILHHDSMVHKCCHPPKHLSKVQSELKFLTALKGLNLFLGATKFQYKNPKNQHKLVM